MRINVFCLKMEGFLLIDKPQGITSFGVVRAARKILQERKIGHLGTLDPLATGLIALFVGRGTKLLEFFLRSDKEYEAEIVLGATSETFDAEGEVSAVLVKHKPDRAEIELALSRFLGRISQMPPLYSALKINGKRACDWARQGVEVKLKSRLVEIKNLEITAYAWPVLNLRVACGSGTYIRSLAHDLGAVLEVGGYLNALRRTKVGSFALEDAVTLADLCTEDLRPLAAAVADWSRLDLSLEEYRRLFLAGGHGLPVSEMPLVSDVADGGVVFCAGELRAVWSLADGRLKLRKQI